MDELMNEEGRPLLIPPYLERPNTLDELMNPNFFLGGVADYGPLNISRKQREFEMRRIIN